MESCDKQLLGLVCAKIRSFRKPEPYKGKGILFKGEVTVSYTHLGLIGKKIGMTSVFSADGKNIPCTVIEVGPCVVTQVKTVEKDVYKRQAGLGPVILALPVTVKSLGSAGFIPVAG